MEGSSLPSNSDDDDFMRAAREWAATHGRASPKIDHAPHLHGDSSLREDGGSQPVPQPASVDEPAALKARADAAEARCRELETTLERYAEHGSTLEVRTSA
jgi:hypothetical protein